MMKYSVSVIIFGVLGSVSFFLLDGRQRRGSAEGLELPQEQRTSEHFSQDSGAGPALRDRDSHGDDHQCKFFLLLLIESPECLNLLRNVCSLLKQHSKHWE